MALLSVNDHPSVTAKSQDTLNNLGYRLPAGTETNGMDEYELYLDVAQLSSRGWTERLIARFLGKPDQFKPVDHWKNWVGKRAFFLERIQIAEALPDFQTALGRSIRRRELSDEQLAAFAKQRDETRGAVEKWRASLSEEDVRKNTLLSGVTATFEEARRHGYRTPHK